VSANTHQDRDPAAPHGGDLAGGTGPAAPRGGDLAGGTGRPAADATHGQLSHEQERSLLYGLLDDASMFPPGNLPMQKAVSEHLRHETAWFSDFTGAFICPETRIAELGAALTSANAAWIDLSVVVTNGADAVTAAADAVAADPRMRLRAFEVPADRDTDPAAAVLAVATALDSVPLASAMAYIEVPLTALAADDQADRLLAIIDGRGYRPKLRTGGVTAEAFPDETALAAALVAVAGRRIPFKCTAGLHHAVRHADPATGFEHHGFLNVLLGTRAAADGAAADEVAAILGRRDPALVAAAVRELSPDAGADIRWLFTSFGTCSTDEPVADLVGLGLMSQH
jgi:hypothetical protein